ncbi:MAG: hypothetical protein L7H10_00915 [Vulcanisaeta sp.]|nr:hypothetical protein [Vulcanisaeta sp.]
MDLSFRVIQDGNEYQVIIENGKSTNIIKAKTIDEVINILSEEVRRAAITHDTAEALEPSGCVLRGWYIRIPITRLLDILAYLVKNEHEDPTRKLMEYLDTHGLSRSNYRVIIPTLSALGLWRQGSLTEEARELGKAVIEGSNELPNILYRIVIRNCMLREAIERLADGASMDEVIKALGLTRRDEINYTSNLLELVMNSEGFKCLRYIRNIRNYLRNGNCLSDVVEPIRGCAMDLVLTVFNYLVSNRGFHMVGLLNDVDVTVNLNSISTQAIGDYALILQGNKPVGVLVGDLIVTGSNYAPRAREVVDRLEPVSTKLMKSNNLTFSMIVVPMIIKGECPRLKVYVMVGNKVGDWVARVFDIP